ncbi:MAG TPA: hypothetical protein VJ865_05475 [Gemmatimonadaceae bacterium]|nr:hypothetical protein [Gemmatimonadaceae bacterium]
MNRRRVSLAVTLVFVLAAPRAVCAQNRIDKVFAALATDSAAWQQVLEYTMRSLIHEIVSSAHDPTPQPWRLQLPDDPEKELLRTQLRTLLRARQVMPADTLVRSLTLGPLVIQNDTARVEVVFEQTRMCPGTGRSTGFGWSTTVFVPRETEHKLWGPAFSRVTMAGDRVGC